MIKNYLTSALRNLFRHKTFSVINILGLAISMSVCLIIIMIVNDQNSYDKFHENYKNVIRITTLSPKGNDFATSPFPLIDLLNAEYDLIQKSAILAHPVGGDVNFRESIIPASGYLASEGFLSVFSFPLTSGSQTNALKNPYSLVISKEMAQKLFKDQNPLNKTVTLTDRGIRPMGIEVKQKSKNLGEYTITGIINKSHLKSHIRFDYLISMSTLPSLINKEIFDEKENPWLSYFDSYSYVILKKDKNIDDLKTVLSAISSKYMITDDDTEKSPSLNTQKLSEITPGDLMANMMSFRLPKIVIYVMTGLALIVMISACFNYTNLSIARAFSRSKEVGVRKTMGASRTHIFIQFIAEAVIVALFSLALSVLLLQLLKPLFSILWFNKYILLSLKENFMVYIAFLGFSFFTALAAGLFPGLYFSKFNPAFVLKGKNSSHGFSKLTLRRALIISQFSLSLFFIALALTIHYQYKHVNEVDYGYQTENIVNVPLYDAKYTLLRNELMSNPQIKNISACQYILATGINYGTNISKQNEDPDKALSAMYLFIDPNFQENLEIKLLAGRFFDPSHSSSTEQHVVLSESIVSQLGFSSPSEIIGETLTLPGENLDLQVIGVTEDIQHRLLIDPKKDGIFFRNKPEELNYMNIRLSGQNQQETIEFIRNTWKKHDKTHLFEYEYLDSQLASTYSLMNDLTSIITFFSILAVSIACMGLLGMVVYITETRNKEVGIRKAMGAEISQLVLLLSKGFFILLGISALITLPIAWLANNSLLKLFSSHISYGWEISLLSFLIIVLLGLIMIIPQTLKGALTNPVDVLKDH